MCVSHLFIYIINSLLFLSSFRVTYPVNVSSHDLLQREITTTTKNNNNNINNNQQLLLQTTRHTLLLDSLQIDTLQLFTYCVPSKDASGSLMGWGVYETTTNTQQNNGDKNTKNNIKTTTPPPLLPSYNTHISIQGDNIGTTHMTSTQPGGVIRLPLGTDQHIHITTNTVLPKNIKGTKMGDDKVTWFVILSSDKKRYKVRSEERVTVIKSTHTTSEVLVILSENLPTTTEEEEVTVELMSPLAKDITTLNREGSERGSGGTHNDVLFTVLEKSTLKDSNKKSVFHDKVSGDVFWAVWVAPGETVQINFAYKVCSFVCVVFSVFKICNYCWLVGWLFVCFF